MAKDFGNLMKSIRQEKAQQENKPAPKGNKATKSSSVKPSTRQAATPSQQSKKAVTKPKAKRTEVKSAAQLSGAVIPPLDAQQLKRNRVRKNYSFDPDFVEALEAYCTEHKISSSRLIEYTVAKFIGFK